ncbi:esterase FE4-like [Cotesia glomerata]|uniref:esterase FE4-like n=1 Tax=Cotesia glomerata TaxID=32391 RepID=UPI001D026CE4|nr:esterase FE4-like [Cotesia glomerata]
MLTIQPTMGWKLRYLYNLILFSFVVKIIESANLPVDSVDRPIVQVQQGQLQGIQEKNINGNNFYVFRGIPYAKPPLGALRFKDSEPAEPWTGVRDAKKFGNVCAQQDLLSRQLMGKEDCLFLNVYTTNLKPKEPMAVLVWIHGGAYFFGSGNDEIYSPDYLVEKDVIVVTINYRLGIIGFLNLDVEEAPGNQGLKDQVMALKWVQQNIAQFGGDPNRVTIFGESAGSASVHYLTISPLAQGLFQRAILQSGVATAPWAKVLSPSMKEDAEKVAERLGNKTTDTKQLIEYLQSADAYSIIEAEKPLRTWSNYWEFINPFTPSVDSKSKTPFLSIPVDEAIKSGIKVPHIIGYNNDEAIIFVTAIEDDQFAQIDSDHEKYLIHEHTKRFLHNQNISVSDIKNFFMEDKKVSLENVKEYVNLLSAAYFVMDIQEAIKIQTSIPDVPSYLYKFDYYAKDTSLVQIIFASSIPGTSHAEELFSIFYPKMLRFLELRPPAPNSTLHLIQRRFVDLWTNFAKTGNPNSERSDVLSVEWIPVDDPKEYNCLKIFEDLSMIKETNILHTIQQKKSQN